MQAALSKVINIVTGFEKVLAFCAFIVILTALAADVLGRELFGQGVFGSVRVGVFALILCAMAGFGIATASSSHLRPKFMDGVFRGVWQKPAIQVGQFASAAILIFMAYAAWEMVAFSRLIEERDIALDILVWPVQLALPVGFALSAFRHFAYAILPDLLPEEGMVAE